MQPSTTALSSSGGVGPATTGITSLSWGAISERLPDVVAFLPGWGRVGKTVFRNFRREIRRWRAIQLDLRPAPRQRQRHRVQAQARRPRPAFAGVADHGMADAGQVPPDLARPAGLQPD